MQYGHAPDSAPRHQSGWNDYAGLLDCATATYASWGYCRHLFCPLGQLTGHCHFMLLMVILDIQAFEGWRQHGPRWLDSLPACILSQHSTYDFLTSLRPLLGALECECAYLLRTRLCKQKKNAFCLQTSCNGQLMPWSGNPKPTNFDLVACEQYLMYCAQLTTPCEL